MNSLIELQPLLLMQVNMSRFCILWLRGNIGANYLSVFTVTQLIVHPRSLIALDSRYQQDRMALLDYPIPALDVTLQEASRVLQLTLSPELYLQFKNTLSQQREVLQEAQNGLAAAASGRENWVTEQFKSRLLSCTDPLPTSTAIPAVLPPSRAKKECAQLERAAALLWAVAKMYSEPSLVEGEGQTERTQQSEVFAASRIPGKTQDEIKVSFGSTQCFFVFSYTISDYNDNNSSYSLILFSYNVIISYFLMCYLFYRYTQTASMPS